MKYNKPEMEVIVLTAEIIRTSLNVDEEIDDDNVVGGWPT